LPELDDSPAAANVKKTLRQLLGGTTPKAPAPPPASAERTKRAVWRISERAPMGEWVDPDALPEPTLPPQAETPAEFSSSSWMVSSMDLLNGADVSEDHETSPGELFDELNARRRPPLDV
jgi:hypothetical protein